MATTIINPFAFAAAFAPLAVDFDGTNDYLRRGAALTGASSQYTGIYSSWLRIDGGNGSHLFIDGTEGDNYLILERADDNKFRIYLQSGAAAILEMKTVNTYTASSAWLHVLASWDTATNACHLYVNDVADKAITINNPGSAVPWGSATNFSIGTSGTSPGGYDFNGAVAEHYLAIGQYLDFSVEANRRKFSTAAGHPVDPGSDGSTPTGTAPIIYLSVRAGGSATDFATNRGTGGNFTVTGALDLVSPSPWA